MRRRQIYMKGTPVNIDNMMVRMDSPMKAYGTTTLKAEDGGPVVKKRGRRKRSEGGK